MHLIIKHILNKSKINEFNSLKLVLLVLGFVCLLPHVGLAGIKFIPNKGQWQSNIRYQANIPGGTFYISNEGLTYAFDDEKALHKVMHGDPAETVVNRHVVKVRFKNSAGISDILADESSEEYYNFILGNNPANWVSHLRASQVLILKNIWAGIDMEIVAQDENIKYTFIVHPKADPSQIKMIYEGANSLQIKEDGFHINTSLTNIIEDHPISYFEYKEGKADVDVSFLLEGNELSFLVGKYPKKGTLYIDPSLVFSTFSGSVADNFGFTATFDPYGNAYSGGTVYAKGFPVNSGAFQTIFKGGIAENYDDARDAGILKYSPDGTKLLYATYLGGRGNDQPHSMIVNSKNELIILGTTSSDNFPVTEHAYDKSYNGNGDLYVAILSEDGSKLIASTYLGGSERDGLNGSDPSRYRPGPLAYNYGDQFRGEVIVDSFDNIYLASCTQSKSNFPILNGFQKTFGGGTQDGVVVKFNPELEIIIWSSFIGGSSEDAAYGLKLDIEGNVFVCGGTMSENFTVTSHAKWKTYQGGIDGFITKIDPDGSIILASTYVGTNSYDQCYLIQIDDNQDIYVTGQTTGEFPVIGNVFNNKGATQFIAAFKNDLSDIRLSTVFGSGRKRVDLSPSAFLVDLCGRVYVCGWGGQTNSGGYNTAAGNTVGLPLTKDAFQSTTDGSDFYLIILSKNMQTIEYGSYFGGHISEEHVDGGTSRFDRDGKVYQAVCGGCGGYSDFPTTKDAWSTTNNGRRPRNPNVGGCNNAIFKLDLNSSNYAPEFADTTLFVVATKELKYSFDIRDADPSDSIFVYFNGDIFDIKKTQPPIATLKTSKGRGVVHCQLNWQTTCKSREKDTFYVYIKAQDDGCPTPRVTNRVIKIVVQPLPVAVPPAIFCLERVNNTTLKLNWDEFPMNEFLLGYKLVKVTPDGQKHILKTITSVNDKSYTDYDAPNHLTQDYCYYMFGVSICGDTSEFTRVICSIPDEDSIPHKTSIYTVSVENNKNIKIVWNKYHKDDFYYYLVYKKENNSKDSYKLYRYYKDIEDTSFVDSSVNVQNKSYCYRIIVKNQCGLESPIGDEGCSILLTGFSVPFEHHLKWNTYKQWNDGVNQYNIVRWDPTKPEAVIGLKAGLQQSNLSENYIDDTLDYDMGLYYYKVIAYRNSEKADAYSVSNHIELIQKPILHIPNVFSPNDDTYNDLWKWIPVFVKEFDLKIYNRWGERVYESHDRHDAWDGKFKEVLSQDDVFIYIIRFTGWDGSTNYRKGNITVLK